MQMKYDAHAVIDPTVDHDPSEFLTREEDDMDLTITTKFPENGRVCLSEKEEEEDLRYIKTRLTLHRKAVHLKIGLYGTKSGSYKEAEGSHIMLCKSTESARERFNSLVSKYLSSDTYRVIGSGKMITDPSIIDEISKRYNEEYMKRLDAIFQGSGFES